MRPGRPGLLEQGGAAAFFISTGTQEKRWYAGAMFCHDSPDRLELGLGLRAATSLPIMVDGKIRSLEMGDQIIASGAADFIGICRPVMADPDFVEKSMRPDGAREIRRCLYCSNCMTWPNRPYVREFGTCCTVNPATFREASFEPVPAQKVKKVAVIGGGLAGMNAAQTLAQRGHEVTLYEQAGDLGGQWLVASHGADKADFRTLIPYLTRRMREYGVPGRAWAEYFSAGYPGYGSRLYSVGHGGVASSIQGRASGKGWPADCAGQRYYYGAGARQAAGFWWWAHAISVWKWPFSFPTANARFP